MRSLFAVEGAANVFLETIKRGEDDNFTRHCDWEDASTTATVVLRLYEAFGGHARVQLRIARYLPVSKAYVTNLLEDNGEELNVVQSEDAGEVTSLLKLDFRGFEVKTVKLVVGYGRRAAAAAEAG
jgi:alpha-mannosidase